MRRAAAEMPTLPFPGGLPTVGRVESRQGLPFPKPQPPESQLLRFEQPKPTFTIDEVLQAANLEVGYIFQRHRNVFEGDGATLDGFRRGFHNLVLFDLYPQVVARPRDWDASTFTKMAVGRLRSLCDEWVTRRVGMSDALKGFRTHIGGIVELDDTPITRTKSEWIALCPHARLIFKDDGYVYFIGQVMTPDNALGKWSE